ncbi:MAG: hypothetical protein EWV67_18060 [Microcystis sp. M_QC_C_20170808_M2Col]|nr:MAG: hypothetical protein EWV67_18060 [Microcystis sp. M_QC_C_20170808_M2Col]TRT64763.1 MAG: hypothetical protein EWV68_18885 [Microcystis sp. M_QC_C_20170808_M9Col]
MENWYYPAKTSFSSSPERGKSEKFSLPPTPYPPHPTPCLTFNLFVTPLAIFSPILRFLGLYRNDN